MDNVYCTTTDECDYLPERCPTLLNVLVIIVGGIPIAMPTVLSVTLALGSYKLASEGAIVARMSAVEEMAGTDILCSDKTGGSQWLIVRSNTNIAGEKLAERRLQRLFILGRNHSKNMAEMHST
jgi:hypothetical protein